MPVMVCSSFLGKWWVFKKELTAAIVRRKKSKHIYNYMFVGRSRQNRVKSRERLASFLRQMEMTGNRCRSCKELT